MSTITKIPNTQSIDKITMYPVAFTKCEIGGDWYKNELEVEFEPLHTYPDYTEVQNWIMENIDGKTLNIEDVIDLLFDFLKQYEPHKVGITNHITGCRTHFDVDVKKERIFRV